MCVAVTAKARLPTVDSLTGGTTRRLALVEPNGVFVDQASRRHGSADRGNVEHRHVEPCAPGQLVCNEFVPEPATRKIVLLEVARETIGSVMSQKKKNWISDETYAAIREKSEAKGKDKNGYQEMKAEVQRKLRVDKQQQLEGMCVDRQRVGTSM